MNVKPVKICFISLRSYPLLVKNSLDYFGGAEVQISLIAKALAKNNKFKINIVVGDYGQKAIINKNHLALHRSFKHGRFFPFEIIRFFLLLKKINADIYVERTMNVKVGLVALFCRLFGKKFIYMIAHDWDCQKDFRHYLGLKLANLIVAQTKYQQKYLLKNWRLSSFIFPSIINGNKIRKQKNKNCLLWVGRAEKWKQPEIFIKLASSFPQQKFVMICRQGNDPFYYQKLFSQLQPLPNLEFFNDIPFSKINDFFRQAKIFVNTSSNEGFPNTFLQAGLNQVPILSLITNPDKFIELYQCGLVAKNSYQKLVDNCQKLLNFPRLANSFGKHNLNYVNSRHINILRLRQKLQCLGQV